MARWLTDRLFAPVDVASLVAFRIFFGVVAALDVLRDIAFGAIESRHVQPATQFYYYGFEWLPRLPGWAMYVLYYAVLLAALGVAVGLRYRTAASVFFAGHTYLFLLSPEHYLNHQYLISILALLMIAVPAHRALSIDALSDARVRSSRTVAWPLWLLCGLFCVVLFYAGIAKIDADWLSGASARTWLLRRSRTSVLGDLLTLDATVTFVVWGGLLFDATAPALLLWRRTRKIALVLSMFFHLSNKYLFDIGVFPWLMIGATTLFLDPGWPRRLPWVGAKMGAWVDEAGEGIAAADGALQASPSRRRLVVWAIAAFLAVMVLVPLRHLAYPGDVAWNEDGHRFAWRMKLRNKSGAFEFLVRDRSSGDEWAIPASKFLTRRQVSKLPHSPDFVAQHASFLREHYARAGMDVEVRVDAFVSLNGRPRRRFIDPTLDLSRVEVSLGRSSWVVPFDAAVEEPEDGEDGPVLAGETDMD